MNEKKRFFWWETNYQLCQTCLRFVKEIRGRAFSSNRFFFALHWRLSIFFLAIRQKILCGVVKTALCLSIATIFGKKFSIKKVFLPSITDIDRKLMSPYSIFFGQVDDTAFYESKGSLWGHKKRFVKILIVSFIICGLWPKNLCFFFLKTVGSFAKTAYHLSRRSVEEIFFE